MSVFARFAPRLQEAIVARLGWSSLRPVQEQAGEVLLAGMNAVVLAPTAGGKTEASMFPALSNLVEHPTTSVGVIYIAPIKALLNNQAERLGLYTEMVGLDRFVWHGDTTDHHRRKFLEEPTELLMTTPESLEVQLVSQRVDASALYGDLRMVVIDEVHAMAGTDRGAHLMSVVERLARLSRHDVQRVGLSATVGNPDTILAWLQGSSKRSAEVVDPPKKPAARELLVVHRPDLGAIAVDAARMARGQKSLLFCQSRAVTEQVAEQMRRSGTEVFVHHSSVSREERAAAEEKFHHGSDACIVCTSTLELGIDVGDLDRVLQVNTPDTVSSFLQRMGRTGRRAGQKANTTFLCETGEAVLQAIALVELAREGFVEHVPVQSRCWPVLIHQLLALSLADDGVTAAGAWEHLCRVPDFQGIHKEEFDRLVGWMLRDQALVIVSGLLTLGPKAEQQFGRQHFRELYAVFSSPQTYGVVTADGRLLGSLDQAFVDRLVAEASCFLLAGRAWVVDDVAHSARQVKVSAAPRGRKPTWGGYLPQFLGHELCQRVLGVLLDDAQYPYLHESAVEALGEQRATFGRVLDGPAGGVEIDDKELRWWTFAGGRINSTLRYALQALRGNWKVVPDNFGLRVRGDDLGLVAFQDAVARLREMEFWENEKLWEDVAEELPNYRLSKFQSLMPPWVEREMLAETMLDVEGAWHWLNGSDRAQDEGPTAYRAALRRAAMRAKPAAAPEPPPRERDPRAARPSLPVRMVVSDDELAHLVRDLGAYEEIGLDVETTLGSHALCLVQVATADFVALVDVFSVADLSPFAAVLADPAVRKVIHNAAFERSVLKRYGLELDGVVDTLAWSREKRGRDVAGGHSLQAVARRELGLRLDKAEQTSDWTKRPLSEAQVEYAALDAEVVLRIAAIERG